jgi:hypothetical protein
LRREVLSSGHAGSSAEVSQEEGREVSEERKGDGGCFLGLFAFLVYSALYFGFFATLLFAAVKFVKWAWTN